MKTITAIIVGCGHRSRVYAEIALKFPEQLKIVALVDPDKHVRDMCKALYGVPEEMCFDDVKQILPMGKIADCVINGTMDKLHIETSVPLLEQGYDMLLEKPITNNAKDLLGFYDVVKKHSNKVMICHVLRYSLFYKTAKEIINSGEIGEVVHVETQERVGLAHNAISFIRGKWGKEEECGSTMLLQKCCHDIDLACWLNNASKPVRVSSFGGRHFITPEKAPE
ncbi:MAG: Gfo/Idh/MocA family protein, partial [Candidatus Gallimonas sp.]